MISKNAKIIGCELREHFRGLREHFKVQTRFAMTCAICHDEFYGDLHVSSMNGIVIDAIHAGWRDEGGQGLCGKCVMERAEQND